MKKILVLIIFAGTFSKAYNQEKLQEKGLFFKKLEIKKSFDSKTDRTKPAIASFTIPAGAKNFFSINGGIAYRTSKLKTGKTPSKTTLDIFGVYNINNQLKKEQHNFKTGIALEKKYVFGNTVNPGVNKKGYAKDLPLLWTSFTNEYIKDRIDSTGSFTSLFYFLPEIKLGEKFKLGKPVVSKSGKIETALKLMPGLEYQNIFNAPVSGTKGSLVRLFFSASYEWYLKWREKPSDNSSDWINMFGLSANYNYRNDFINNTSKREGYLPLFSFSANFYPFHNENISVGASYQNGSDPVNGIDDQEFWQFVFKFKKDIKGKK